MIQKTYTPVMASFNALTKMWFLYYKLYNYLYLYDQTRCIRQQTRDRKVAVNGLDSFKQYTHNKI